MKDEIEKYADKFYKKMEKRIKARREEREEEERAKREREQVKEDFKRLAKEVVRPPMLKLLETFKKRGLAVYSDDENNQDYNETFMIWLDSLGEGDADLRYTFDIDFDDYSLRFGYEICGEEIEDYETFYSGYSAKDINSELVEKIIIEGLKDVCK